MGGKSMDMSSLSSEGAWTAISRRFYSPETFAGMQRFASKSARGLRTTRGDWASIAKPPGIDYQVLRKWLSYMEIEAREAMMKGGSTMGTMSTMNSNDNNSSNVTNNFNATFATPKPSNGLMNDFSVMKSLRRV